ncbi:MAG: fibronectin type III domain-containing protein, partial [Candidatus Marinimicrobia bacterium]|nr:fibronectin type III domain-containing protein [Candidatus Neomarinimicrobiota bacterium]
HENHTVRYVRHLVREGHLTEDKLQRMKEANIVERTPETLNAIAAQFFRPNQVKNTKIKRKSATEVEVSWSKPESNIIPEGAPDKLVSNVNNILCYKIARLDGQEWVVLEPGCKETTYNDTGLEENEEYFYRVSAINAIGEGKPFPNVPDKIDDVTAIKSGTKVNVSWKAPNNNGFDIKEYKIERSEVKYTLKTNRETISDVKDTEYQDTVPKEDEEYFYRVSAINAIGEGELSKANNPAINEDDS